MPNLKAVQSENESAKKALCELEYRGSDNYEFLVQDLRDDAEQERQHLSHKFHDTTWEIHQEKEESIGTLRRGNT